MRSVTWCVCLVLIAVAVGCGASGSTKDAVVEETVVRSAGPYLGQDLPGPEPVLFAPGIVSTGGHELNICFTQGGDEAFFCATGPTYRHRFILHTRIEDGVWTPPREAPFADPGRIDSYPFLSPDGNRVFFCSSRSNAGGGRYGRHHEMWYADRVDSTWTEPQKFDFGGDLGARGTYPSVAANGNLYFNGNLDSPSSAIYVSRFENGGYHRPEILGPKVYDEAGDHHPFVAPDESYVLFTSEREEGSFGGGDLFMIRRQEDGAWSEAKNLGPKINTPFAERSPFVTADGKYLFFSSSRPAADLLPVGPLTYEEVSRPLLGPGNGLQDIYWVSAEVLQSFFGSE